MDDFGVPPFMETPTCVWAKRKDQPCTISPRAFARASERVALQAYQLEDTVEPARTGPILEYLKHPASTFQPFQRIPATTTMPFLSGDAELGSFYVPILREKCGKPLCLLSSGGCWRQVDSCSMAGEACPCSCYQSSVASLLILDDNAISCSFFF